MHSALGPLGYFFSIKQFGGGGVAIVIQILFFNPHNFSFPAAAMLGYSA
jgi:hypothetical protein